jgi:hypothetical protein
LAGATWAALPELTARRDAEVVLMRNSLWLHSRRIPGRSSQRAGDRGLGSEAAMDLTASLENFGAATCFATETPALHGPTRRSSLSLAAATVGQPAPRRSHRNIFGVKTGRLILCWTSRTSRDDAPRWIKEKRFKVFRVIKHRCQNEAVSSRMQMLVPVTNTSC